MLIIRSTFFQIVIPDNEPYAIYSIDYYVDKDGTILTETDRSDVYEYGDIIIQTPSTKYIMKKVYSAYDYAAQIIDYIEEHRNDDQIFIDMYKLNKRWEYHEGTFEIEPVVQKTIIDRGCDISN